MISDNYEKLSATGSGSTVRVTIDWTFVNNSELNCWIKNNSTGAYKFHRLGEIDINIDANKLYVDVENPWSGTSATAYCARVTPVTQTYDLINSRALDPEALEAALDKAIKLIQEIQAATVLGEQGFITSIDPFEITDAVTRATKFIQFDSNGDPTYVDASDILAASDLYQPKDLSAETAKTSLDGTEEIGIDDSGTYKKVTVESIVDYLVDGDSAYRAAFDSGSLVGGVLTVTHGLGRTLVNATIYDNNNKQVLPDEIEVYDNDTVLIDLSSFGAITGTWFVVVLSGGGSGGGSGEINTVTNVGGGAEIGKSNVGTEIPLRTIVSSDSSITVAQNINTIGLSIPSTYPRTDEANVYTQQQVVSQQLLDSTADIVWDLNDAQTAMVILSGDVALSAVNMIAGGTYILEVVQTAGGNSLSGFGSEFKFPGGVSPTFTATSGAVDILTFFTDGTSMYGILASDFS